MKYLMITVLLAGFCTLAQAQQSIQKSSQDPGPAMFKSTLPVEPLYFIHDKEITKEAAKAIIESPDKVKSISMLSTSKSVELYGERGKNGVVMIDLKDKPFSLDSKLPLSEDKHAFSEGFSRRKRISSAN